MSTVAETIAGALLSLNGVAMYVPPRQSRKGRKNIAGFRTECARYFTVPHTEVLFVTRAYEHFLVRDMTEAESVWRTRELWYVLTVRSDVLRVCEQQIPIRRAAELNRCSFSSDKEPIRPDA
jgi:hypothetical protein